MKIKTKRVFKKASKKMIVATMILGLVFSSGNFASNKTIEKAQADSSSTSVTITNALPVASATSIDSAAANVTLTENTTKTVSCVATVTDNNGYADITSVEARLYLTTAGAAGAGDSDVRYILTGDTNCVPSGGSGLTETYTCNFSVQYYADPGAWTCQVTPTDTVGAGTADTDTITVDTLLALDVTASIGYGSMGLGTDTNTSPITATVTNTGNAIMDPQVSSAAAMSCTTGTIPIANQEYSATASFDYSTGTDLSATPTTLNLTLPTPEDTNTPVSAGSYWGILIPANGVEGACTGSNTFTAVAGT
ncbi:MAG: hypothetical protein P1P85_01095 [Patescibacteria group bacterium]|nr:hypothetical protein [Patescibacteria group bacterium]